MHRTSTCCLGPNTRAVYYSPLVAFAVGKLTTLTPGKAWSDRLCSDQTRTYEYGSKSVVLISAVPLIHCSRLDSRIEYPVRPWHLHHYVYDWF